MPFKSQAQRRKFAELLVKGEISPETFEEWNRSTGSARLPERVKATAKGRKKGLKKKPAASKARPTVRSRAAPTSKKKPKSRTKRSRR
jgi:hypothetical protein